MQAKTHS